MKSTIKFLILILLGAVAGIFILAFVFILKPQMIITSKNLNLAKVILKKEGIVIDWTKDQVKINSKSLYEKHLDLSFENLHLDIPAVSLVGDFQRLDLSLTFTFKKLKLEILDAGPVSIYSDALKINLKPSVPSDSSESSFPLNLVSSNTKLHDLDLALNGVEFSSGGPVYRGNLKIKGLANRTQDDPWTLSLLANVEEKESDLVFKSDLEFRGTKLLLAPPLVMKGNISLSKVGLHGDAAIEYNFLKETAGDYKINVNVKESRTGTFDGALSGKINEAGVLGKLQGVLSAQGNQLELGDRQKDCAYDIRFMNHFKLECPSHLRPLTFSRKIIPGIDLQKDLDLLHFMVKADLAQVSEKKNSWNGSASVDILTDKTRGEPLYDLEGGVLGEFKNSPLNKDIVNKLKSSVKLDIKINQFESLVTLLKKNPYAVPAPLNKLAGSIECQVKGDLDIQNLKAPFDCQTKLKSSFQSLFLTLQGEVGATKKDTLYQPVLKLLATFDDVQLALPHFGITGPPPMIPDGRFQKTLKTEVSKSLPLQYEVTLKVPEQHPIRLLSNLSKAPIPIVFDGKLISDKPMVGNLEIKEFPANLFRRDAIVKYFKVKMTGLPEEAMSGLVEVKYTDYTIKITLDGTVQEPVVRFDSVPPLNQDQIISVLLFGRTVDDTMPDQTSSVESAQAALADHALALSSMYILASTPVESVGYNSDSRTFTAKLHLAKGTSLDIGTNGQGVNQVGVNRHLGGPWYIYTYMYTPTDSTDQSTAAFLEWVLRY